jgi:EAL domain-containing protein (putative c-di-GMP-specific phosphodiesterase class I)
LIVFPEYFKKINFSHAFQPIVDIEEKEIVSYEVLLRGGDEEPPYRVFEKVDTCDQILFDQFSREKAFQTANRLGIKCGLNFNFSPSGVTYNGGELIEKTLEIAEEYQFDKTKIFIEVTENEEFYQHTHLFDILNMVKQDGVHIVLDDFGSGYAGLNMLIKTNPETIKIDMDLVRNSHKIGSKQAVIRAICHVAQELGLDILAEGVETEEEFQFLKKQGITLYQGYYFSKPFFETLPKVLF